MCEHMAASIFFYIIIILRTKPLEIKAYNFAFFNIKSNLSIYDSSLTKAVGE